MCLPPSLFPSRSLFVPLGNKYLLLYSAPLWFTPFYSSPLPFGLVAAFSHQSLDFPPLCFGSLLVARIYAPVIPPVNSLALGELVSRRGLPCLVIKENDLSRARETRHSRRECFTKRVFGRGEFLERYLAVHDYFSKGLASNRRKNQSKSVQ